MPAASQLSELGLDLRELERVAAQRDALHESLRRLVAYVRRVNEYMNATDQQTLRDAQAALEESK